MEKKLKTTAATAAVVAGPVGLFPTNWFSDAFLISGFCWPNSRGPKISCGMYEGCLLLE
jgi:hypothetical protein